MKVLVTGSTGLIGSALVTHLKRQGHDVVRLLRRKGNYDEPAIYWDIENSHLNAADLQGIEAVVHLAGENIAGGRWTEERKQRIVESRVQGTRLLAETLAKMENPPKVLVSASATGYYGNRGNESLTEVSGKGEGFLADTCHQWEEATRPASAKGIRVVNARLPMVLSPNGSALKAMYWPFKLGVAGNLGNGKQYMGWISLSDAVGAIEHVLTHDQIHGPVNMSAPNPVTNAEFTRILKSVVTCALSPGKIWAPPVPGFVLKMVLGEMGEEVLLASQRVQPVRLLETGYRFQYPELKDALKSMF